ncbi:glycosyltransferase family 4 protein [Curtobacterium citreum]|uniref:glycosyltransferase family 4 protein n=1 Tax=Curtobacterium citreum TaxID=2036 RepID=UPI00254359CC|nr:glycosyltransferase family 4 protein [Curtobacterium citreum]WIJ45838.1 glycosyltransferase family 4 protein [Curtobacterium citreum]
MSGRVVWIVNHYVAESERDGRTSRHEQFARLLGTYGWHAVLVGSSTVHPSGRQTLRGLTVRERRDAGTHEVVRVRGRQYRGPGGRVLDMAVFSALVLVPGMLRDLPRPDVVVGSSLHPFAALAAAFLARRSGARFVFEPRDLWPETLVALGGKSERSLSVRALRVVERALLRRADALVSPLAGAGEYYARLGAILPCTWISNGTSDAHREEIGPVGHRPDEFVVTYLGSVGRANALEAVVDAMSQPAITSLAVRVRLQVVGDGPALDGLRRRAAAGPAASRIEFTGRVPQEEARAIGRASDCLVANMRDLPLYRWGVAFNKLFEYARVGRPVVIGAAGPVPVFDDRTGVVVDADDPAALAEGIASVVRMRPEDRVALAERAHDRVDAAFTYSVLTERLAEVLDELAPLNPVPSTSLQKETRP